MLNLRNLRDVELLKVGLPAAGRKSVAHQSNKLTVDGIDAKQILGRLNRFRELFGLNRLADGFDQVILLK